MRAEALSPVRPNWMTKIFVAGDVVSFLAQAGGELSPLSLFRTHSVHGLTE
jgi:hypothetical protein